MNAAHLHLALCHLPVVGSLLMIPLLGLSLWFKSPEVKRVALVMTVLVSLTAPFAFFTGEAAEDSLDEMDTEMISLMHRHEASAETSESLILATGALALAALGYQYWKKKLPNWMMGVVLAALLASSLTLAWTSFLGGKIGHPEINNSPDV
jgi:hypothetical protein